MGYINLSWPNKELFCLCSDNMSTTDQQLLGQLLASRYVITFLVSLFGNSVIIHIVRKDNSMKTTTNYLIVNQACADILVTTMELLNDITYYFEDEWFEGIIGIITCKLLRAVPLFFLFSLFGSLLPLLLTGFLLLLDLFKFLHYLDISRKQLFLYGFGQLCLRLMSSV